MGMSFEWADVNPGDRADIYNDVQLTEYGEVKPGEVGVSMDTGTNGIMLWGRAEDLADWAEDVARRLRSGEGRSGYGEARTFVFLDRFHLVLDADGDTYEAGQLDTHHALRDNSGAPVDADGEHPEGEGDTWRVMGGGRYGQTEDGRAGFLVETRKVLN